MKSDASDESSYETSDTFENPIDEKGEVDRDTLQRVVVQGDVEATLPTGMPLASAAPTPLRLPTPPPAR